MPRTVRHPAEPVQPLPAAIQPAAPQSVRERILATAKELFYREGARAVGVDTVVAQSGVAKTSLYRWFPSKDALIAAVLEEEARERWEGWDTILQRAEPDPRARVRALFAGIVRYVSSSRFRGCPFMNVITEFPDEHHPGRIVAVNVSLELRRRLDSMATAIEGVRDSAELSDQLALLVEGAFAAAHVLGKNGPQKHLISAADALVEAQLRPPTTA